MKMRRLIETAGLLEETRRDRDYAEKHDGSWKRVRAEFNGIVADMMNKMTGGMIREVIGKITVDEIW